MTSYIELFGLVVLLMLPFLYETSHIFRYYFKYSLYYGLVSFNSVILIPLFLLRPCDVRNFLWASAFCRRITTLISLRWELRGKEHLEKERACIIVANHQSSLDVLGMFNIWHVLGKCTVVAKRELFYAWPFGLAAWLAGLIFIDRVRGEKARETLNQVNRKVKQQNIKLWIFPEGTRRNTGDIHAFKKGAFHMAIDEQIPILPIVFSSYCSFLNDKKKILNAGNIIVTTLPAIPTVGLTKDDLPNLMEKVHKLMLDTYKQTSNEVLQHYAATAMTKNKNSLTETKITNNSSSLIAESGGGGGGVTVPLKTTKLNALSSNSNINYKSTLSRTQNNSATIQLTSQAEDISNKSANITTTATTTQTKTLTLLAADDTAGDIKDHINIKTKALVH